MSDERKNPPVPTDSALVIHRSAFPPLVVTADDFGIGVATSRGIVKAHLRGPVTATSFMAVAGDFAAASVPLLADAPDLEVGLHVVLTRCGSRPLVATAASGLVARDGQFHANGRLWLRAFAGRLDRAGVADEIAAQAERFHALLGRRPAYVDGHHHSHQLPVVRHALLDVIAGGTLPPLTRTTVEPPAVRRHVRGVRLKRRITDLLGTSAAAAFAAAGVRANRHFVGMIAPADVARPFPWAGFLARLPSDGVTEWCVHPGEPDPTLGGRDDYTAARATELAALTGPAGVAAWEHLRGRLATKSSCLPP